jgi:hypothetical protein
MNKTNNYFVTIVVSLILGAFITEFIIKNYYRKKTHIKKLKV